MKLKRFAAAAVAALGILAAGAAVHAEEDVVTVLVDNVSVVFDQQPVILEGHTMVPVRAVFEQAGAEVTWDQPTQTATIARNGYTVTIKYGDTGMYKNGERIELEAPAIMINDRVMIPVRAIAEAMDFAVTWDGHHSMVLVATNGKPYRAYAFLKTGFQTLEDISEFYSHGSALETKEIIVSENGDTLTAHFYRYENGILKVLTNNNVPSTVTYASKLLLSGTGYIISDLTGTCFVDIMVTGGVYKLDSASVTLYRMRSIENIYGRNLYNTYDDNMLYHIIYTSSYTPGAYKEISGTGVISSVDLPQFKILNGYVDADNPRYIELYIELSDGTTAVIKPYQV